MNSFNPSKYSTSSEFEASNTDVSNEIVEKGHKNILKVDIGKFEDLCRKFRDKKDLKIKKLVGQDKDDFDLMISYVHLLYGTAYYKNLYEKVKTHFKNISSVKPGTVGAYFAGCLVTKNSNVSGCSLGCAGSMPLPKEEEGWSMCDKAVIMAEKSASGYSFSVVKPAEKDEDMNPAYLFVEGTLTNFSGFNKYEKENLKAMGCKKVKVIGYSSDMNYSEIYREPRDVEKIKHRYEKKKNENDSSLLVLGVVLFIILLIILCVLAYKYYHM